MENSMRHQKIEDLKRERIKKEEKDRTFLDNIIERFWKKLAHNILLNNQK
jgi:hypothetical protein